MNNPREGEIWRRRRKTTGSVHMTYRVFAVEEPVEIADDDTMWKHMTVREAKTVEEGSVLCQPVDSDGSNVDSRMIRVRLDRWHETFKRVAD